MKRDCDRAIADFNEAIRLNPRLEMSYENRGAVYGLKGDHERALADLNSALLLDSQDALAYQDRGVVHYEQKDYDRAIADSSEVIRLDPKLAAGQMPITSQKKCSNCIRRANSPMPYHSLSATLIQ
jgi:tetratricopeptide (TPR) repeat protein